MPIVDIEIVCQSEAGFEQLSAAALANALGGTFASQPGTTWVKLRFLDATNYAENASSVGGSELPVFVSVLHARVPQDDVLGTEARAITHAVALHLGRPAERVHVRYEPSAIGRQAFGGVLVR